MKGERESICNCAINLAALPEATYIAAEKDTSLKVLIGVKHNTAGKLYKKEPSVESCWSIANVLNSMNKKVVNI